MPAYLRPSTVDVALDALHSARYTVLAGGTDYYPARVGKPLVENILDISAVAGLRGITATDAHWRIGATTTWTDVMDADLPPLFNGLKLAAREVGGVAIQNAGTICGNLCNASPAADGMPPLLALDAQVEVRSKRATRQIPLNDFVLGNRKTALTNEELATAVLIPRPLAKARSHFVKLGARRYLVISIVMAAAVIETDDDVITAARITVGACSPVALRLPALENALIGQKCDATIAARVDAKHVASLIPIDDVRASSPYRQDAAVTLLRRLLSATAGGA